jgi:hypothetical protein
MPVAPALTFQTFAFTSNWVRLRLRRPSGCTSRPRYGGVSMGAENRPGRAPAPPMCDLADA